MDHGEKKNNWENQLNWASQWAIHKCTKDNESKNKIVTLGYKLKYVYITGSPQIST